MISSHQFDAPDGVPLFYHELGSGFPLVLLHGLFSSAEVNWIKYGHAQRLADLGFRVIMPDLRAHGRSGRPHEKSAYPPDVLASDGHALISHLGLSDYHLGGYSLGARTSIRMVVEGATPKKLIAGGMGLDGLLDPEYRADHFRHILDHPGTFVRGSDEWMAEAFLKTTKSDPLALRPLLDTFVATSAAELHAIRQETLVLTGADDRDNGSPDRLAETLANARFVEVPGNHMNVITKPAFGRAMAEFLSA